MFGDNIINAGRMLNDIDISSLKEEYIRNVLDLISLLKFKTIVFDFDGTLTHFDYANDRLLPCKDNDINEYSKLHNIYENVKIPKTMQYILNELYEEDVYILTVTQENVEKGKNEAIKKFFPTIKEENVIHVRNSKEKLEKLKEIHDKHNREIIFVEDTAKTLLNVEETYDFVRGYHISSLIA